MKIVNNILQIISFIIFETFQGFTKFQLFSELFAWKLCFDCNSVHTSSNINALLILVTLRPFTLFEPTIRTLKWQKNP